VGQGWTDRGQGRSPASLNPARSDAAFSATLLRVQRDGARSARAPRAAAIDHLLVRERNAVVGSNWSRFAHDAWTSAHPCPRRSVAYCLLQTDANDGEAAALARMQAVLRETPSRVSKTVRRRLSSAVVSESGTRLAAFAAPAYDSPSLDVSERSRLRVSDRRERRI